MGATLVSGDNVTKQNNPDIALLEASEDKAEGAMKATFTQNGSKIYAAPGEGKSFVVMPKYTVENLNSE